MKISSIYSNGMVLQRNVENRIPVFCGSDEKVECFFDGNPVPGSVVDGGVDFVLPAQKAGGPHRIEIMCGADTRIFEDILFGDVFVLGGQSNMELPVIWTTDYHYDEILSADFPMIRQFEVPKIPLFGKMNDTFDDGEWVSCVPASVPMFSAIGFYFAKYKYLKDGIPVGLIQTAVGGAPVESLMSEETLRASFANIEKNGTNDGKCNLDKSKCCLWCYQRKLEQNRDEAFVKATMESDLRRQNAWQRDLDSRDPGLKENWELPWDKDIRTETFNMPQTFLNTPYEEYKGSIWLQKTVTIPENWVNEIIELRLGTLMDSDVTYVNGKKVGGFEFKYPPRRYFLKPGTLKEGENTITVRLGINGNTGGAVPDCPYCIKNGEEEISLTGPWKMRKGAPSTTLESPTFFNWAPTALYNSMIHPLSGLMCKAILFYQGESNCEYPQHYGPLIKDMVNEWRELLGEDTPFYMAEITYWLGDGPVYESDPFEGVRNVQREVVHEIPNAYLIPTYDLGMYNDLHPQNKKEVAMRFLEQYSNCEA
ncbi:MAG: hypothetical protein J5379_01560 [Clostridiales bacterium]|nr:hypothetical protein [Clostridiales bacterium]